METMEDWLRETSRGMVPAAVLAQPLMQLQGVGTEAEAALAEAGIHTVLDLAASALFGVARQVVDAAEGRGPLGGLAALPADLLDDSARLASASAVARMGLVVLRPLDAALAARLEQTLPAPTVRDLALWPPARAARRLLQIAYGAPDEAEDPEAPSELRPRMGRQPVERVQYQHLLFERVLTETGQSTPEPSTMTMVGDFSFGGIEWPLDLSDALLGRGFEQPGFGFRVTVTQSWTSVGLALGQLLHSVALAPGEATRVAVVDWSRRIATGTREDIVESEALSNALERKRSISEVINTVASEVQRGDSRFSQTGAGWGIGAAVGGEYKGVAGAVNFGYSRADAQGSVFSSSQGQRSIGADLSQRVQDRTEQAASLTRGRRASIVSEVSVQEAERLSTRVVANYNHMHALSVLYFEVVQIYRALTEVVDVEPLLYLPVRPFDFSRTELIERYRGVLAEVALNSAARDALLGIERQEPTSATNRSQVGLAKLFVLGASAERPSQQGKGLDADELKTALGPAAKLAGVELHLHSTQAALIEIQAGPMRDKEGRPLGPLLSLLMFTGTGTGTDMAGFVPWAQPSDRRYNLLAGQSNTPYRADLSGAGRRLDRLRKITASKSPDWKNAEVSFDLVFLFKRLDSRGEPTGEPVHIRASQYARASESDIDLLDVQFLPDAPAAPSDAVTSPPFALDKHLQANALHYTMALLRRADPALLGLVFGQLKMGGLPLLGQVDPQPLAHAGNYLVFRWGTGRQTDGWADLLKERGLAPRDLIKQRREALVPMPTGGVFAEAVLGRFNAAEKLDLTRFWNWQDSPIPLVPTEIAPLQAGIREGATPLTPSERQGQFSHGNIHPIMGIFPPWSGC